MGVVVLDTNVALDWLVFEDAAVAELVRAIEVEGAVRVITSAECFSELQRVLGYTNLALDPARQAAALERYVRWSTAFKEFPAQRSRLPLCRDADDQKFVELAWHSRADALVTKDKALLEMKRAVERLGRFRVLSPSEYCSSG